MSSLRCFAIALVLLPTTTFAQNLGNVWHLPRNAEPNGVPTMRNPALGVTPGTTVTFYNGSYSLEGDQSGGQLFYRKTGTPWNSAALTFDTQNGNNKYWRASLPTTTFAPGDVIQYYFRITFTDRDTTFIYGTESTSLRTANSVTAENAPFSFRITVPWPGGNAAGYPSDPASRIHHWKEEAVIGNGYITVQLDQNGSLYDIYYPSVGNRHAVSTANEGYRGPEEFPNCPLDQQANGQMNVVNGMGGIGIGSSIYWMKNQAGNYSQVLQRYVTNNNVAYTTSLLNVPGNNIGVQQYDFCPVPTSLPVVAAAGRTNYGVYVKRFLLTNHEGTPRTIDFYYDVNFNVNGGNGHDGMYFDASAGRNTMVVYDNTSRSVTGSGCGPDGYNTEYKPASYAGAYLKDISVYFGTVMKHVTNAVTGQGLPADGSWRDHTASDNHEGWIARRLTLAPGVQTEIDIMIVGSWDDTPNAGGTHAFWGTPLVDWFYGTSMSAAQAQTETYWTQWLESGVTIDFPGETYDALFRRSLLVSALHVDAASGSIIAGMHNGAYPFVWPRDLIYAAITFARTAHLPESSQAYRWLRDTAYRDNDPNLGGEKGFFYQKYTTDGYQIWTSPQVDETASVPWGVYYHYLITGDAAFLSSHWDLVRSAARASSEDSGIDSRLNFNDTFNLMDGNNAWEDAFGLFLYSNASVVRGLRDAASIADLALQSGWGTTFRNRANNIQNNGIIPRINARVEPSDISHLGLVTPYEVFEPNDPLMTNMIEWLHGRQSAGGFNDNLVEQSGDIAGLLRRYNHSIYGGIDNYWNGGPWFLATSWYGEYYARWQDYLPGKALADINRNKLDLLVAKLGPMGLGAEQIAPSSGAQKYPGFWLQTAWPNVWESHTTLIDQMLMFLDFKPTTNGCSFAPKLPSGWAAVTVSNFNYRGQRLDVSIQESVNSVTAIINKRTAGPLAVEFYLRIPGATVPALIVRDTSYYQPTPADYDTNTGRVRIAGDLLNAAATNRFFVTYGDADSDGDGMPDWWEMPRGLSPLSATGQDGPSGDLDNDGFNNLNEYRAGTEPNNSSSFLRITELTGGGAIISWSSVSGRRYDVYATTEITAPFQPLATNILATGSLTTYTNLAPVQSLQFYRVLTAP